MKKSRMILPQPWLAAFVLLAGCDLLTSPTRGESRFRDVSVGEGFTCAVTEQGGTYCWGQNIFFQQVIGDTLPVLTPRLVVTSTSLSTIYVGYPFCGADRHSRLHCWNTDRANPFEQTADLISDELDLIVDGSDFAVDEAGRLVALSNGSVDSRQPLQPRRIVAKVTTAYLEGTRSDGEPASHYHGCALTSDGEAFCEGTNRYGELGLGPEEPAYDSNRPYRPVLTDVRFGSLYAAAAHTCGISISQEIHCWGEGYGPVPRKLMPGVRFASMDAGAAQNCALTSSGAGLCWNHENQENFREVAPAIRFRKISVTPGAPRSPTPFPSGSHACGISVEGDLYCWGSNDRGQLGIGTLTDESTPVRVSIRD